MKTPIITVCAGVAGWFAASITRPAPMRVSAMPLPAVAPSAQPVAPTEMDVAPQIAAPAKPITERFSDAMGRREPFATAAQLVEIVDGMTAADFEQLLAKPKSVPSAAGMGLDGRIGESFMEMLVARWLEVNPTGALAQIKQLEKSLILGETSRWIGSGDYFKALVRLNPRMLLDDTEWMNHPKTDSGLVPTAFEMLARKDANAARKYLERVQAPSLRTQASRSIADGIARSDPAAAAVIARSENDATIFQSALRAASRRGAAEIRAVLQVNDRKFEIGSQLTELVVRFPDEDWAHFAKDTGETERHLYGVTEGMAKLRARMSPEEQRAILNKVEDFPKAVRNSMIATFFFPWSQAKPREALEWAAKQPGLWNDDKFPASYPFGEWARADRPAAMAWLAAQPASTARSDMSNGLSFALAYDGKLDEAAKFFSADGQSTEKIRSFASAVARHDAVRAADWVAKLPAGLDVSAAVSSIAEQWAEKDPKRAAQWLESLPLGAQRDAAVSGFMGTILQKDVEAAAEWVATIGDGAVRGKAAGTVYGNWLRSDPFAARRWIRELPGIDETFRNRMLRRGWQ